jgi:hypothetical protein
MKHLHKEKRTVNDTGAPLGAHLTGRQEVVNVIQG